MNRDYSKWALGCLFREIRKEFPRLYGDTDTVSKWALGAENMGTGLPVGDVRPREAAYWIRQYFIPSWRSYGFPETPIILEIKRRLAEYNHAKETH